MVALKALTTIILFVIAYSIPFIIIEDKMRVKCDKLYEKYYKWFEYEYEIEYKLRRNPFYRLVLNKQDKKKWKNFRKTIYFDTDL